MTKPLLIAPPSSPPSSPTQLAHRKVVCVDVDADIITEIVETQTSANFIQQICQSTKADAASAHRPSRPTKRLGAEMDAQTHAFVKSSGKQRRRVENMRVDAAKRHSSSSSSPLSKDAIIKNSIRKNKCDICNLTASSLGELFKHLLTRRHKRARRKQERDMVAYKCQPCNMVFFSSSQCYQRHLAGELHHRNSKAKEKTVQP